MPPIQGGQGLTFTTADRTRAFVKKFFPPPPPPLPVALFSDPPMRLARPFKLVTHYEIAACLAETSNTSAPRFSATTWRLLKWALQSPVGKHFISFVSSSVTLGYLPPILKKAVVVLIPKPCKPDYALPKAYCPIALMETLSKLIEKVVVK
ncbi:uncharacterized protein LAESUDRAFT_646011 [Laetiporus sulphureus 93-53]|uniref:Reverse transcriptase domain-containing protein n=1 Tax=Laetiporus sulphureus 93-53 TaxID=1314785 RepID=A0A165GCE3_9APHY|nr:uncharacterized protein LAESUDRAFT_646011 [Laetiporus sulphureus 93-53]KZT10153.1 hypothetical protein LAESUDRAFT_646011 [Laetiporus sulphureus 93-53]